MMDVMEDGFILLMFGYKKMEVLNLGITIHTEDSNKNVNSTKP